LSELLGSRGMARADRLFLLPQHLSRAPTDSFHRPCARRTLL
jgi:hypothetical protein